LRGTTAIAACADWFSYAVPEETEDETDDQDDHGPYAAAIRGCRARDEAPLHIEEHRAIARARMSKWTRLITFLQSLKGGRFSNRFGITALSMVILSSAVSPTALSDHRYDSDSYLIAIDNCSSRCITNSMQDFVSPPTKV
jgi:hypothetical protein